MCAYVSVRVATIDQRLWLDHAVLVARNCHLVELDETSCHLFDDVTVLIEFLQDSLSRKHNNIDDMSHSNIRYG